MSRVTRMIVIIGLVVAVALILVFKKSNTPSNAAPAIKIATTAPAAIGLPRLLDLGATQCIPCKMMAPILEELKREYPGKLQVDFIDVWKDSAAGRQYNIDGIPTQIFFDASGKELFRHQGFMPKEDILAQWKQLGFDLTAGPQK